MRNKIKKIVFVFALLIPFLSIAQNEDEDAKRNKERIDRKMAKAEEKGRQKHLSIQKKETKKRMKKHARQSQRLNENKKEFFWEKWARKRKR